MGTGSGRAMRQTDFAANLKRLREAAGLTQAALAEKCGLHTMGVTKLEAGDREPGWPTVLVVAEQLGVSTEEFRRPVTEPISEPRAGRPSTANPDSKTKKQ